MDIGKSVSYIFEDDDWINKAGLGALIMLVPILNFAAFGYEIQVIRNVVRGEPRPLTYWNDLSRLFMDGLWLAMARLVYSLPIFGLMCVPFALAFPLLFTAETERQVNQRMPFIFLICGGTFAVLMVYALIMGLISPAVTVEYVRHGSFASCFNFGAMLQLVRDNLSAYMSLWAATLGIGLFFGLIAGSLAAVSSLIPCVGQVIYFLLLGSLAFLPLLIIGHLEGQLIRADEARAAWRSAP